MGVLRGVVYTMKSRGPSLRVVICNNTIGLIFERLLV